MTALVAASVSLMILAACAAAVTSQPINHAYQLFYFTDGMSSFLCR
ncbi:MAG: hypothetical protein ACK4LQ_02595 [Pararhodobacter sp.]